MGMSDGMYCKICNRLIIPNKDGICRDCKDAMKRNGYVKVVRCKDCKHRDPEDFKCDCGHDIHWELPRPDNWFCTDGELKE